MREIETEKICSHVTKLQDIYNYKVEDRFQKNEKLSVASMQNRR